jgi:hypothetical protein
MMIELVVCLIGAVIAGAIGWFARGDKSEQIIKLENELRESNETRDEYADKLYNIKEAYGAGTLNHVADIIQNETKNVKRPINPHWGSHTLDEKGETKRKDL